jgi:hypothetical protein
MSWWQWHKHGGGDFDGGKKVAALLRISALYLKMKEAGGMFDYVFLQFILVKYDTLFELVKKIRTLYWSNIIIYQGYLIIRVPNQWMRYP